MSETPEIPEGISDDARETWPSPHLITSWLGDLDHDVEWRPGETTTIPADDPEAVAAARRFRDVLGRFASGVTVVTTISGGEPVGMTCQSFSSVSLDPPLVLFVPARTSRAWPLMQRAGKFCVNFLADGQDGLSNAMASRGSDKFADIDWAPSAVTGSPTFPGALGHVDCTIHAVHEAGDHYVVIGKVVDLVATDADGPLLFFQGKYRTVTST
ncbi:flavin reductase family protein [Nocardioides sp.]|uniref:flavin reductase family protein n=1 Tax=Nocardioides sp. TaxID=35761 RepID=UPI00271DA0AF|nr:flavin reductase family protein [Nocardioides sp.]MDO9457199.1 flavin reductase family protein [Nocardioides sp.]